MKSPVLRKETRIVSVISALLAFTIITLLYIVSRPLPTLEPTDITSVVSLLNELKEAQARVLAVRPQVTVSGTYTPRLIFYNRPPKTGSTTVRIAMKKALDQFGMTAAKCFNMIEWNEMAIKTIINRRNIDFYGCHTRLTNTRFAQIAQMRAGNVTFITNTRDPKNIILSAYLQENRLRKIDDITDDELIRKEVEKYKLHIEAYPIDALYVYHGADIHLTKCPHEYVHEDAMRRVAERFEIVVDLERPEESAAMVELVTGLRPDFSGHFNQRTADLSGKMLSTLAGIDTAHKTCGNMLVHKVLLQQFNIIKDRLMQNRCFNEDTGAFDLCEHAILKKDEIAEYNRIESYQRRDMLRKVQLAAQAQRQA